jgi:hypothetical protein
MPTADEIRKLLAQKSVLITNRMMEEQNTKDPEKKKLLVEAIDKLKEETAQLKAELKTAAPSKKLIPGGVFEKERAANPDETADETLQRLFNGAKKAVSSPTQAVKKSINLPKLKIKSSGEQLADLQLSRLKKQVQQETLQKLPTFSLPQIPKDTATSIVIASIIAIFFMMSGTVTKFSQLWGYAYNSPVNTGSGPETANESWNIPDILHSVVAR